MEHKTKSKFWSKNVTIEQCSEYMRIYWVIRVINSHKQIQRTTNVHNRLL